MEQVEPASTKDSGLKKIKYLLLFIFFIVLTTNFVVLLNKNKEVVQPQNIQKNQDIKISFTPELPVPKDSNVQKGPFYCPSTPSFCKERNNYKNLSLSGKVSINAGIYAAFSGKIEAQSSFYNTKDGKKEEFNTLILKSEERGLKAIYYFIGKAITTSEVKAGDKIGTTSGKAIEFKNGDSLSFELYKSTKQGMETVILSSQDF